VFPPVLHLYLVEFPHLADHSPEIFVVLLKPEPAAKPFKDPFTDLLDRDAEIGIAIFAEDRRPLLVLEMFHSLRPKQKVDELGLTAEDLNRLRPWDPDFLSLFCTDFPATCAQRKIPLTDALRETMLPPP
jgi:hypothetical protein